MKIKISPRVLVMALSVIIAHSSTILQATTIRELNDVYNKCLKLKTKTEDQCKQEFFDAYDAQGCHNTDGSQGFTIDTPCEGHRLKY